MDNVQHNSLLGGGVGYFVLKQRTKEPCGTGVHCGESHLLVMSIAVYVGDKMLALKRSLVVF